MSFELHNNTLLGGYLAHMVSLIRQRGGLIMEAIDHPDMTPERRATLGQKADPLREGWDVLRRDLLKVLNLHLRPFNDLCKPGPVTRDLLGDPERTTMRRLKYLADKARRKDPSITLMGSWDLNAPHHQPPEKESY